MSYNEEEENYWFDEWLEEQRQEMGKMLGDVIEATNKRGEE